MCLCHITVKTHFRTLGYGWGLLVPEGVTFGWALSKHASDDV